DGAIAAEHAACDHGFVQVAIDQQRAGADVPGNAGVAGESPGTGAGFGVVAEAAELRAGADLGQTEVAVARAAVGDAVAAQSECVAAGAHDIAGEAVTIFQSERVAAAAEIHRVGAHAAADVEATADAAAGGDAGVAGDEDPGCALRENA